MLLRVQRFLTSWIGMRTIRACLGPIISCACGWGGRGYNSDKTVSTNGLGWEKQAPGSAYHADVSISDIVTKPAAYISISIYY